MKFDKAVEKLIKIAVKEQRIAKRAVKNAVSVSVTCREYEDSYYVTIFFHDENSNIIGRIQTDVAKEED